MECRSPNCPQPAAEGSRFCEYHRDLFAAIGDEIDAGKNARLRSPERKRTRRSMYKRCAQPGCDYWALPREEKCGLHLRLDRLEEARAAED